MRRRQVVARFILAGFAVAACVVITAMGGWPDALKIAGVLFGVFGALGLVMWAACNAF